MDALERVINSMRMEREYAKDELKEAAKQKDREQVQYYKGEISVFDRYITDFELMKKEEANNVKNVH